MVKPVGQGDNLPWDQEAPFIQLETDDYSKHYAPEDTSEHGDAREMALGSRPPGFAANKYRTVSAHQPENGRWCVPDDLLPEPINISLRPEPMHISLTTGEDDDVHIPSEDLPDDLAGMVVCSLCRDFYFMASTGTQCPHRSARIVTSILLLLVALGVQAFLLIEIKRFVTPADVYAIRKAYSTYEFHMYSKTTLNQHGNHRGVDGTFNASRFDSLPPSDQEAACRIPLSRPQFFGTVLFLWTVCCMADLKSVYAMFRALVYEPEHCDSMREALQPLDEGDSKDSKVYLIGKLTIYMRVLIFIMVILPRSVITMRVLYLGSRWLLATTAFGDLVLNAVALEFVLLVRSLLFVAVVSPRSKHDLQNTKILKRDKVHSATAVSFMSTTVWGVVAVTWVVLYAGIPGVVAGLQMVLPAYRWDVQQVCTGWFDVHYCVDPPCSADGHSLMYYFLGVR
jgi:hypothetical protein